MHKHWPVFFLEHVAAYLYNEIGSNSDEVLVECRMVQFA